MQRFEPYPSRMRLFCSGFSGTHFFPPLCQLLQLFFQSLQVHTEFLYVETGCAGILLFGEALCGLIGDGDWLPLWDWGEVLDGPLLGDEEGLLGVVDGLLRRELALGGVLLPEGGGHITTITESIWAMGKGRRHHRKSSRNNTIQISSSVVNGSRPAGICSNRPTFFPKSPSRHPSFNHPLVLSFPDQTIIKLPLIQALLFIQLQFRPMNLPLPPEAEYDQALLYMQQAGEQDFALALQAVRSHKHPQPVAMRERERPYDELLGVERNAEVEEAQAVRRYFTFLQEHRRQQRGLIGLFFYGVKFLFQTLFRGVANLVLPQSLFLRIFYPPFHSLYFQKLILPIQRPSLKSLLLNTRHLRRKSILVAVSGREINHALVNLINSPPISQAVAVWFTFTGSTLGDKELSILGRDIDRPQLILCRMDACEEIVIITRFLQEEFGSLTAEVLKTCYEKGVKQMEKDRKIMRLYRTYMLVMQHKVVVSDDEDDDEDDGEEELYRPPPIDPEIAAQNQAYRAIQAKLQQSNLRHQDQQQLQRRQLQEQREMTQLRKIRLQSIPPEPKQGNIIRISFRCPNGSTIVRNFPKAQKLQLIYTWVQVNDEIEFELPSRTFELMHSYPLRGLSQQREGKIGEVFEDDQEKIVIREL